MAASEQTHEISVIHCVAKVFFGHLAQVYVSCPILTKCSFGISLLFKLKYAAILLLSYIVDCE